MLDRFINTALIVSELITRPYRNLGRIGRTEFVNLSILYTLMVMITIFILTYVLSIKPEDIFLGIGLTIFSFLLMCRIYIQRLHDFNISGYWSLLFLLISFLTLSENHIISTTINFVYIILWFILALTPGTKDRNIFGDQPEQPNEYKILRASFFVILAFMASSIKYLLIISI